MLKIKKIAALWLVLALAVGLAGCQPEEADVGLVSDAAVSEAEVAANKSRQSDQVVICVAAWFSVTVLLACAFNSLSISVSSRLLVLQGTLTLSLFL
jgi:hypothetical protein